MKQLSGSFGLQAYDPLQRGSSRTLSSKQTKKRNQRGTVTVRGLFGALPLFLGDVTAAQVNPGTTSATCVQEGEITLRLLRLRRLRPNKSYRWAPNDHAEVLVRPANSTRPHGEERIAAPYLITSRVTPRQLAG